LRTKNNYFGDIYNSTRLNVTRKSLMLYRNMGILSNMHYSTISNLVRGKA
jgi:hypothetical protein